ncbi:chemotaxis protein CheA [Ramlibacter sp. USB13]|uniref:Chemotaxis protein CheA n=1 Tax=Ramlibacter cellulosilyticus TaxID=2764187 RepID=A0A923SAP1_9BURK|nr:chemotaxis protein CheA [Ramlibacter cellulosilyticus]MBC5782443.1 chemotaxis protein CheA [Ramlibacter cellulosilyticus]
MFQPSNTFGDPVAFRTIFFEEAQEHLANVEAILLRMDTDAPHPDDLNAIFRAVHSIKGSAAMLGCTEIAALTHLQENLLDLLRKGERPIDPADVNAMLKAGDVLRLQVLHRRGTVADAPDATSVEALLRERVAQPATDAVAGQSGPVTRSFRVKLGPLAQPIDELDLDMMLTGLSDMGTVKDAVVDNTAGGGVTFEVLLQGAAADLQSVLALVVAPEQIAIETLGVVAAPAEEPQLQATLPGAPKLEAVPSPSPATAPAPNGLDEFFVDPAEFKNRKNRAKPAEPKPAEFAAAEHAPDNVDLFVSPEQFRKARKAQPAAAAPAQATPAVDVLHDLLPTAHETTFIRVSTEKIDLLVNLVGELVITEAMLARTGALAEDVANDGRYAANTGLADLSRHTRNLQEAVLAIRMLPISNVFQRFPRVVHELAARLGKKVELKMFGEATELDRGLIEKISDPLTHLVRNAIDHGLEPPDVRLAAGKPAVGTVTLRASQRGGNIVIEVSDDGRGLDRDKILAAARRRGIPISPEAPDSDIWQVIFEAGFSTADQVTDVSGRGVGMDVVKRNIQALSGTVDLTSVPGQGTRVTVSVPLTLAIMEAMTIAIGGETYVLPLASVVESLSVAPDELHTLPGHGDTLRVRDEYLPVHHLAKLFPPQKPRDQASAIAVIVETDGSKAALLVDELVGQQQVVVKSLETNFRKVPGLSGATVMGDGSVALILDVAHLVRLSGREGAMLL